MSSAREQRQTLYEKMVGSSIAGQRFVITRLLGFGGMGAVYEATQTAMNRSVALKLIPTHDETAVKRFEREALTISQLRHPNTITVFDYGQAENGFLFLAMELLDGQTLSDVIKAEGPLHPRRAVHIASQICKSLNEAHKAGIVHRDIKPDNIILIRVDSDPDVVKVLDFGIAKAVMGEDDVNLTGDGRIIGTPRYMSPEQILGESVDHRSDVYSLGCILFEMLCGAPPFQQSTTTALMLAHAQETPPSFAQRLASNNLERVPHYLEDVVRKALEKAAVARPQSVEALRLELEDAMNSVPVGMSQQHLKRSSGDSGVVLGESSNTGNHLVGLGPGHTMNPAPSTRSAPIPVQPFLSSTGESKAMAVPPAVQAERRNPAAIAIGLALLALVAIIIVAVVKRAPVEEPEAVVVAPATEVNVPPTTEVSKLISIDVDTNPPGAKILREGKETGQLTPTTMALPRGEKVKLVFSLEGYREYVAEVVAEPGGGVNVNLVGVKAPKEVKKVVEPEVKRTPPKVTKVTKTKKPPIEPVVEPKVEKEPEPERTEVPLLDDKSKPKIGILDP